jgi:hypothetical protein
MFSSRLRYVVPERHYLRTTVTTTGVPITSTGKPNRRCMSVCALALPCHEWAQDYKITAVRTARTSQCGAEPAKGDSLLT